MTHFYAEFFQTGYSSDAKEELKELFQTKYNNFEFIDQDGFFLYAADINKRNFEIQKYDSMIVFSMNKLRNPPLDTTNTKYVRNYQNGYSSIISYNRELHEIEIITDPFGLDYIYIAAIDEKRIAISSHMKYILAHHTHLLNKLDYDAIIEYLFSHFIFGHKTFFVDVKLLPYNSIIKLKNWKSNAHELINDGMAEKQFWYKFPTNYEENLDFNEKSNEVANLLKRLIGTFYANQESDVSFLLSGGLDSRLLVSTINDNFKSRSEALTFDRSPKGTEIPRALEVTNIVRIPHHTRIVTQNDIVENWINHMWSTEGISTHAVSHFLKLLEISKGNKVYIDGYMGDTQLGGSFLGNIEEEVKRGKTSHERLYLAIIGHGYTFPEKVFSSILNNDINSLKEILVQGVKEQSNMMWETENDILDLECLLLHTRGRRYTFGGSRVVSNYGPVMYPYYHPEIFSKYIVLQPELRKKRKFEINTLTSLNPDLASLSSTSRIWYRRFKIGVIGYKFLVFLESIFRHRLIPAYSPVPIFEWLRKEGPYRDLYDDLLMDDNSLMWNLLDNEETKKVFHDFFKRKNNYYKVLRYIVDLELTLRLFFSLREVNTDVRMISNVLKFDKHFKVDCELSELKNKTRLN
ncbi:MAG: asparagine synthase-related protein [Promethearchaeota archaeon]